MSEREELIPISGMRKIIATKMKKSLITNAQTVLTVEVDMTESVKRRKNYKEKKHAISYNDLVLAATTHALVKYPLINSEMREEDIRVRHYVNIGMAVALEEGLIVPNIKNAQDLDLVSLSEQAKDLSERARTGRLKNKEYREGTFTVSNLGMMGIQSFEAIINESESGILAVGAIEKKPVVTDNTIEIRPMMKLVLSYDHRLIDGALAAEFLVAIKNELVTHDET